MLKVGFEPSNPSMVTSVLSTNDSREVSAKLLVKLFALSIAVFFRLLATSLAVCAFTLIDKPIVVVSKALTSVVLIFDICVPILWINLKHYILVWMS